MNTLNPEQRDALQELMNIAMGLAADQLARLTNAFVILSVPRIHTATSLDSGQLTEAFNENDAIDITRQSFFGLIRGETFVCFGSNGAEQIADLMGYDDCDKQQKEELMQDVANILSGACINSLAQQFGTPVSFGAPSMFSRGHIFKEAFAGYDLQQHRALVMEISFVVESCQFKCDLLLCIAEETLNRVLTVVDNLLSEL